MKKHLAATTIQTSYRRYKIHKLDVPNSIKEKLIKSLKDGKLDLCLCNINDEILIKILPLLSTLNITKLNLKYNYLGAAGATALAEALTKNTSIKELYLDENQIGPDGAKALAKTLETNTSIKKLDLYSNNLGDAGAIALANALKANQTLTDLDLYGNNLGDDLGKIIQKELEINNEITEFNKKDNMANIKSVLFKYYLSWILNKKSKINIPSSIVPDIADFLLSDFISNKAAKKILNKSGSRQQQAAQLAAEQDPNPEEIL